MGARVRVTREEALDEAAGCIGSALRARWCLDPDELHVEWSLDLDGYATLHVYTSGAGAAVQDDCDFDAMLTALRDEHIDVLDGERWIALVGEDEAVCEMPADAFAARMRSKVK
jgi:hypothetical protein